MKDRLLHIIIQALVLVLGVLPQKIRPSLARWIGGAWFRLDRRHRDIALDNLGQAYKSSLPPSDIEAVARGCFVHLAGVVLELPGLFKLNHDNLDDHVVFHGVEHAREALRGEDGVIFMTAHYGNWELMALALPLILETPLHVMVRPLDLAPADEILTRIRSSTGNVVLDKDKSAGAVAELIKQKKPLGILLDQNASWYEGVYVPFFGRVCCTNKGLAIFALRHKARVVPVFNRRRPDGRYDVEFFPPLELKRTGSIGRDVELNTMLFNDVMEARIRRDPAQWLWVHRRWRIKAIPDRARRKMGGLPGL